MNPKFPHTLLFLFSVIMLLISCRHKDPSGKELVDERPNIILFLIEDSDFSHWGCGGGPKLSPAIDSLAAQGLMAVEYYCNSPLSRPSRYTLYTGQYAGRCSHEKFIQLNPKELPANIDENVLLNPKSPQNLGKMLQKAGYKTAFTGVWKMGYTGKTPWLPPDADPFDTVVNQKLRKYQEELCAYIENTGYDYAASVVEDDLSGFPVKALRFHNLDWYAKGAVDFIRKAGNTPFFLSINLSSLRFPCNMESLNTNSKFTQAGINEHLHGLLPSRNSVSERIMEKGYPVNFRTAGAVWTDDLVNTVLKTLDKSGLTHNTMVIFTADQGTRFSEGSCYQRGVNLPFIIKWPDMIKDGVLSRHRFSAIDILPTLAEAAGVNIPRKFVLDGISRLSHFKGAENPGTENSAVFFEYGYSRAVLKGEFKYISLRFPEEICDRMRNGNTSISPDWSGKFEKIPAMLLYPYFFDADQLYNITDDPDEKYNLAGDPEYEGKLKQMRETMNNFTAGFRNPYNTADPDPYYQSPSYQLLNSNSRNIEMNNYLWYRKGCY